VATVVDHVRAALFDVDGTLVDTNYLHAVTWWEAFRQAGCDVPMASIHRAIGMGSDKLLDALLPRGRDPSIDDQARATHLALYSTYLSRLRAFAGAAELLRACAAGGLRVVLASSADEREFAALRAAIGAGDAITEAASSADVDQTKPAPDLVEVALRKAGASPDEAVFVGDTVWDVRACQRAGVPCIGLLSGGISAAELADAGAVEVYDGPAHLLGSLNDSLLGAGLPVTGR
jgi:HAD superfamily hydrolase (TIGR01509 family)